MKTATALRRPACSPSGSRHNAESCAAKPWTPPSLRQLSTSSGGGAASARFRAFASRAARRAARISSRDWYAEVGACERGAMGWW